MTRPQDWVEATFGRFAWCEDAKTRGAVEILGEWERQQLVSITPPFELRDGRGRPLPAIRCHRRIAPALSRALEDLKRRELCHLVNTFDGCFMPRHQQWDPARGLSRHTWGIAVDLNARLFPYGSKAKQHPRLIEAFKRQGFAWGGDWRTPDPMHFEIVDLAQPAREVSVYVDGEFAAAGLLHDGQTLVPVRAISQALGASVESRLAEGEVHVSTNWAP